MKEQATNVFRRLRDHLEGLEGGPVLLSIIDEALEALDRIKEFDFTDPSQTRAYEVLKHSSWVQENGCLFSREDLVPSDVLLLAEEMALALDGRDG